MQHTRRIRVGAALVAASALLMLSACSGSSQSPNSTAPSASQADSGALLTIPREDMGTFSRNFNPFSTQSMPMTNQAIYEPLFIYSATDAKTTPWLATEWAVNEDSTQVTFTLRDGVKWSDGQPLVAQDVVTTITLQKEILGGFDYVQSVTAVDDHTVQIDFSRPYTPGLYELGGQVIVPDHIWSKMDNAATNTNEDPVGTGPFSIVKQFSAQSFDLAPNPNYWQPDKVKIAGVRMLAFAGNDGANLALQTGDADWGDQFIPDVENTFVAPSPDTHHYWYAKTGSMVSWQFNTQKAPYDDVNFRKALSMAIDRDQITAIAMNNYTTPADCTGLSNSYASWVDQSIASSCTWTKRDVAAANQALDDAGYKVGADGFRTKKDGSPLNVELSVGSASSDWLSVMNIIAQNLADVKVQATVDSPDWASVVSGYENGSFDTGIVWSPNAATPYQYFRNTLSTDVVKPVGTKTTENYHRYGSAAGTQVLAEFVATGDEAKQHDLVNQLQKIYNDEAPLVPLFTGPEWGAYSSARFAGWPSESNPYATLSTRAATTTLILTSLTPAP
ncbi:MAG: ABC transporter substrate-binding protein [Corynebacterium sp.]|uniref:ABC transporter substrate-binding protein n=1 Tax=Corynebacterium sp. TaxID=1720 RepID=UPI0026DF9319|nr:ABC transporter substrate-binding protein [Corynebacterium sp.]MDO5670516.1 ABC transporter substrate-binding protein [Corynebacterium sp.]